MPKINYIAVQELSKIINIHVKTLNSWLCHYSLTRFVKFKCRTDGKSEYEFAITKASLKALRRYLAKKKRPLLDSFNSILQEQK